MTCGAIALQDFGVLGLKTQGLWSLGHAAGRSLHEGMLSNCGASGIATVIK